jgi:CheY-like chemotaxis protein
MSKTLLVVEADRGLQKLLTDTLTTLQFAVITARTGREALAFLVTEAVSRGPVDGILLDLELGGLDALTTLKDIRDRHEGIPVIIISDGTESKRVAAAMQYGAVVITNLDEYSPGHLVHMDNVIDINRCEQLPSDPLEHKRLGLRAMETARSLSWDRLVAVLRNPDACG